MKLNKAKATLTRPADTAAYALNDVIASSTTAGDTVPLSFNSLTNSRAGTGYITKAKLWVDGDSFSTPLRLHLFDAAPTQIADNEPFQLDFSMAASHVGFIDFPVSTLGGTGSDAALFELDDLRLAVESKDINGGNPFYGVLTAQGAFTPTASQRFYVELTCDAYEY